MKRNNYYRASILTILFITMVISTIACKTIQETPPLPSQGPFLKKDLESHGLITIDYENATIYRTIYPPVALQAVYRRLLDEYVVNINDIQAFIPITRSEKAKSYKLGIYMYEYGNTPEFMSIAIEAEFINPESNPFTVWYTFNYDIEQYSQLRYSTMFIDPDQALLKMSRYVIQDVTRQKKLRNVSIEDDIYLSIDNSLLINLFDNFVLIPSKNSKNKFSGIKIYLNRFGVEEDSNYAINVPTYYFRSFLNKRMSRKFVEEEIPLISSSPSQERYTRFPDITPLY